VKYYFRLNAFFWMSFPVKRSQKCPRKGLPIRVKITKFQMTHQEKIYMEALKSFFLNDFLQNSEKTDEKVPQLPHQSDLKSYLGITMNQIIF